jgi:hypothetical protein
MRTYKATTDTNTGEAFSFVLKANTYTEAERKASSMLATIGILPTGGFFLLEEQQKRRRVQPCISVRVNKKK